jgi:predicted ATPase
VAFALGVHEALGESIVDALVRAVGSRQLLVVLDNCEHVVEACRQLST